MTTARPQLADFLCFSIYSANLAFGKAYKPLLDRRGITYTQYIAIVALYDADHQTVSGLGEKLFLESNTLTPILKKLEALGYVTRRRDPDDERQVVVSLTEAGRELREQSYEMELGAATGLSVEEMRAMQKGIAKLRDNLREHAGTTSTRRSHTRTR
ncbi:MarR family winged helix-turn-helix transcriptional regulator [Mycolicibacterium goodii]|uniref:MarR family transcriptional regulator n=1 Tax=Mycolicibacterium goodii TaxID=134601 RepID=A0ABS6HJT0_MYCGD|nr:MarR family transcriptional regulator [Mycolicibacterium goodii]MBU8822921.1 MarR family transcriptional regulator [Mycolicibacterium goodii]MBU8839203.1 MarR family transcriptional regulator [Mycolicibacterium goodii]OKH74367.1 MarR family transcriptional regulator [Mycobacterium sp. SWH-M5]